MDVNEIDLTASIPAVATSTSVICLRKTWKGPEKKKQFISTTEELIDVFGRPDSNSYTDMMSALGYLKWGNKLWATRVMPIDSTFAGVYGSVGTSGSPAVTLTQFTGSDVVGEVGDVDYAAAVDGNALKMLNLDYEDPDLLHDEGIFVDTLPTSGSDLAIIAKSRGTWGNYIKVAIIDKGTYDTVTLSGGATWDEYWAAGGTLTETLWNDVDKIDLPITSQREFVVLVQAADQTTINESTVPYSLKEAFLVSTNENAKDDEGVNIFAPNLINSQSKYIRIALSASAVNKDIYIRTTSYQSFSGGRDIFEAWDVQGTGQNLEDAQVIAAYNLYANSDEIDVNIFIDSNKGIAAKAEIVDICETRMDCIAVLDCPRTAVINQSGNEVANLRDYRRITMNYNTSYAAFYGNWLEVFDPYNGKYRWIPASGYIAGIMAKTDDVNDPWWAPAGLNRAVISDARRLAWSPTLGQRDILYKNGINPIVTFAGQGKVVWGQKTLLDENSAFNRINVRRLFIVLEKAISTYSKYYLFQPNDEFTRLSVVNSIEPFLRDVRGRRGIYEFLVVCDERNNTPERIDRQELWCDIYIKPVRTAEFIVLNFVATKTGASFTELVAENTANL